MCVCVGGGGAVFVCLFLYGSVAPCRGVTLCLCLACAVRFSIVITSWEKRELAALRFRYFVTFLIYY